MTTTLQKPAARSSLSFQIWILVNFTTYGAWPPVTYLTYLTGPTQAFRGQCINKSLFKFTVIYLCKTYSSTLRRTWWPLHYRNLQPGLRLSFQSWILVNFTTYGAWPPVTYLTYLTGPTQAFHGQCINKSLFKFIVILLCKTYSTTLRKHPVTSSYTLQLININIYTEKYPSTESLCRSRQKSYSCHLTTRNLFDRSYTGFPWTMH